MPTSWPTITDLSATTLHGVANSDTGAEEGDIAVKNVTITPYDTLRVANGEAAAGLITIRADEDVIAAARESYELSAGKATATASTGAAVGVELDDDIFLKMADNYRIAHAVSVSQNIENETYGEYTLTTYYDLMLIGSNARPILAVENAARTEKVTQDVAWTIDLNGLFSDADGDPLSYKVSVNGAEAVAIEGSTYTLSSRRTTARSIPPIPTPSRCGRDAPARRSGRRFWSSLWKSCALTAAEACISPLPRPNSCSMTHW